MHLKCVCLEGMLPALCFSGAKLIGRAVLRRLRIGVSFDLHDGLAFLSAFVRNSELRGTRTRPLFRPSFTATSLRASANEILN